MIMDRVALMLIERGESQRRPHTNGSFVSSRQHKTAVRRVDREGEVAVAPSATIKTVRMRLD